MHNVELLNRIRTPWLATLSQSLASAEGVRASFYLQLERFFDLLSQSIETGDPAMLAPVLDEWAAARPESDLEKLETSLSPLLSQILLLTYDVVRDKLNPEHALALLGSILPIYAYSLQHTITQETQLHVNYVSADLENARISLERLDKSKSDFISVAAHELKTPLTLIEGYASMLREILPTDTEKPALFLKGINNGTRRLHEIIDDMIDVSMIDNDLLSLHYQPLWLNRLLSIIQAELAESISSREQNLEIRPFPGSEELTFGDAERLYQALKNVISNAIKYTPDGGIVVVDGRRLPGFVEITISDSGIGIDPEDQARIFEKFGRLGNISLHSSGKTKFKGGGPGLGLPIAKGIFEAHGGTIWVESAGHDEQNCPGSTFHILLPVRSEPPDDKTAKLYRSMTKMKTTQVEYYSHNSENK